MKNKIKQEKGVTLTILVITVITLMIITGTLIYNVEDSTRIKKLTNLYNDIDLLRTKVTDYYEEYGEIPAKIKYTKPSGLSNVLSKNNDTGDFYVIDLEAMKGITLNHGNDYEKIINDTTITKENPEKADQYKDLYIINKNSHNIFYAKGVSIQDKNSVKMYYTDYTIPDETVVDLRYIDGILIPENYYYIGKSPSVSESESIVISNKKDDTIDGQSTNQFIWTKQIVEMDTLPTSIKLDKNQNKEDFLKSVNANKGYFRNPEGKVQYTKIEDGK